MPLDPAAEPVVRRGDGDVYRRGRMGTDAGQQIRVPDDERGFGSEHHAEAIAVEQAEGALGQPFALFKRV